MSELQKLHDAALKSMREKHAIENPEMLAYHQALIDAIDELKFRLKIEDKPEPRTPTPLEDLKELVHVIDGLQKIPGGTCDRIDRLRAYLSNSIPKMTAQEINDKTRSMYEAPVGEMRLNCVESFAREIGLIKERNDE